MRKSGRPCWAVPISSPGPATPDPLGDDEPVRRLAMVLAGPVRFPSSRRTQDENDVLRSPHDEAGN